MSDLNKTDHHDRATVYLLEASRSATHRDQHSKVQRHLQEAIDAAEAHAKHLENTVSQHAADKYKAAFAPHVERIVKIMADKGTKLDLNKSGNCQHGSLLSKELCKSCGYMQKSLSASEETSASLVKSMARFAESKPLKEEFLAKAALLKAKIYDFASRKQVADLPSKTTPKEAQPIVRDGAKGITNRTHLKQTFSPDIMPDSPKKSPMEKTEDERGVHPELSSKFPVFEGTKPGTSVAGILAPSNSKAAKEEHKKVLEELKAMPAPKLGKADATPGAPKAAAPSAAKPATAVAKPAAGVKPVAPVKPAAPPKPKV